MADHEVISGLTKVDGHTENTVISECPPILVIPFPEGMVISRIAQKSRLISPPAESNAGFGCIVLRTGDNALHAPFTASSLRGWASDALRMADMLDGGAGRQ